MAREDVFRNGVMRYWPGRQFWTPTSGTPLMRGKSWGRPVRSNCRIRTAWGSLLEDGRPQASRNAQVLNLAPKMCVCLEGVPPPR